MYGEKPFTVWEMSIRHAATAYIRGLQNTDSALRPTISQVCKDFGLAGRIGEVLDKVAEMRGERDGRTND